MDKTTYTHLQYHPKPPIIIFFLLFFFFFTFRVYLCKTDYTCAAEKCVVFHGTWSVCQETQKELTVYRTTVHACAVQDPLICLLRRARCGVSSFMSKHDIALKQPLPATPSLSSDHKLANGFSTKVPFLSIIRSRPLSSMATLSPC